MLTKRAKKGIIYGFLGGLVGFLLALFIFATSCTLSFGVGWKYGEFSNPILNEGAVISLMILVIFIILGVKRGLSLANNVESVIIEEKKGISKSWFLAKVNLISTLLLVFPYLAVYLYTKFKISRGIRAESDILIISGALTIFGFYLLIPIFIGFVIGLVDNFYKKKHSRAGFIINLILALGWITWFYIISIKGLQFIWTNPIGFR